MNQFHIRVNHKVTKSGEQNRNCEAITPIDTIFKTYVNDVPKKTRKEIFLLLLLDEV